VLLLIFHLRLAEPTKRRKAGLRSQKSAKRSAPGLWPWHQCLCLLNFAVIIYIAHSIDVHVHSVFVTSWGVAPKFAMFNWKKTDEPWNLWAHVGTLSYSDRSCCKSYCWKICKGPCQEAQGALLDLNTYLSRLHHRYRSCTVSGLQVLPRMRMGPLHAWFARFFFRKQ